MGEYHEIRTDEDAAELKNLWSKRNPGVILSVNFHPYYKKNGEKEYRQSKGLAAITIRVLVTKTKPNSEVEIICRDPILWSGNAVFFSGFDFDRLYSHPRVSFLPDLSAKNTRYDAMTRIMSLGVEWRTVD